MILSLGHCTLELKKYQDNSWTLLWTKDQPGITAPIIGPRTLAHLEDVLGILDKTLDDDDRSLFDALVHPDNAVSDFHNSKDWIQARIL